MNEHEIRLRALELALDARAEWLTTDQVIATAGAYADFVLGAARHPQSLGTTQEPLKFLGTMPEMRDQNEAQLGQQTSAGAVADFSTWQSLSQCKS